MSSTKPVSDASAVKFVELEKDGSFERKASSFRNFIEKGGQFKPEKVGTNSWATRTLIVRKLKGLEDFIDVLVVAPPTGWESMPAASPDTFPGPGCEPVCKYEEFKGRYLQAEPNYEGRFTVPMLWDTKTETVVNNESSEIIRMFNREFNEFLPADKAAVDLYPEHLREEIDSINEWVYDTVNNGVYRAGFAGSQSAYEAAVTPLFESLDRLEKILAGRDYLVGNQLTEADVRLFVTAIRFDVVYYGHFKCNVRSIRGGYPAIHLWLRKLYWTNPAFSSTCRFDHIKTLYYWSQVNVNPHRIVPVGPVPDIVPL
ncbi:Glutathione S-transferase omega-like 2 [Sparassis crispa]|uniref:Glutathione S-transferase omega-like 2 n=1 Tax=Sparassis crispa TaxID=139825 RepID=A0A401GP00_9APHY|nr:Glutathione S-transferase omega-like 2 [Sparassis crispa]GBE83971.1 Glutathione S-transferase omega-like 2 [Sparassis crispa]